MIQVLKLIVLLVALVGAKVVTKQDQLIPNENGHTRIGPGLSSDLTYIGTVDNVSVFGYLGSTDWNRSVAAAYCADSNLELLSIKSKPISDLLRGSITTSAWYWTSLIENREPTGFVWNDGGHPSPDNFAGGFDNRLGSDYHLCGAYWRSNATMDYLSLVPCTQTNVKSVLCQTPLEIIK